MHNLLGSQTVQSTCCQSTSSRASCICSYARQSRTPRTLAPARSSKRSSRTMSCSATPAGGQKKDAAEIIAEDQGGQEFDTSSKDKGKFETEGEGKDAPKEDSAEVNEVAEKDQGGREFEPLPVKRILVDN